LQKWQRKLDQYRSGVSQQRQKLQQIEGAARSRLGSLRQNVQVTAAQIKSNEIKLQRATEQLSQLEAKLAVAKQAYKQKQSVTAARLRFLQRRPITNEWIALLQSQTLDQFLDRRWQLKLVYQADQRFLVSLKDETEHLNDQKNQIKLQKDRISLLSQQLLTQKAEYEAQAQTQERLVSRLDTDRRALETAEDQLVKDAENIGVLIQQRLEVRSGQGTIVVYGTGRMSYPSNGPITSGFGWRVHPVLGYSRFHSGTDFGAEYGTPIRAADRGTVIFAGEYGGYGNAVVIDHGNGLTTLYGHASALYVQEGQVVQRGQVLAAVGSTGLSTGPHLHFEVRQNGEPVDPIAYLLPSAAYPQATRP
jgi:murein DD-endopeptidase MepM/ murein hydrolase activator NlpD